MRRFLNIISTLLITTLAISQGAWAADDEPRFPTCEGALSLAPALYAIKIYPSFTNYPWIRERIAHVVEYGQPYLSPNELERLPPAIDKVQANVGDVADVRATVSSLLNMAEFNLVRDFNDHVEQVVRDLKRNSTVTLENEDHEHHAWLSELLARVEHYRDGISIERGAWYWQHARYEASQKLVSQIKLPDWIAALRPTIATTRPKPTKGDFNFLLGLKAAGPRTHRIAIRSELQREYNARAGDDHASSLTMARVPNLEWALASLVCTMCLNPNSAAVTLDAYVPINDFATEVRIRFDPWLRYFTVGPVPGPNQPELFYQAIIGRNDQLEILDEPPLPLGAARARSDLTHFAY